MISKLTRGVAALIPAALLPLVSLGMSAPAAQAAETAPAQTQAQVHAISIHAAYQVEVASEKAVVASGIRATGVCPDDEYWFDN
jgi:hypothetical protein